MQQLVFATNNPHKLSELRQLMAGKYEILSLNDIGCHDDIPETAPDIDGNALMKAQWIKERYGYDCFSDDTGLEIDALGGEPGVRSARYAGDDCNSEANIDLVLAKLGQSTDRTARFRTAIALIMNGQTHLFHGKVEGRILTERHGEGGFGYDAVFKPDEAECSFAQMTPAQKNAISHRGRAVRELVKFLQTTE